MYKEVFYEIRFYKKKEKHDIEKYHQNYTNTISKSLIHTPKAKETAEDITQNVFLKYMISEHTFSRR